MPQLDVYRQSQTAQNNTRVVRNAQPSEAASQVVGETITAIGELGVRIEEGRAKAEAAKLEVEAKRAYDQAYRELEADPDAADQLESRLVERQREIRAGLLKQVKSGAVRDTFDQRLTEIESAYVIEGRNLSRTRTVEGIKADMIGLIDGLEKTAQDISVPMEDAKNPNRRSVKGEAEAALALIDGSMRSGFIGKDVAAQQKARVQSLLEAGDSERVLRQVDDMLETGDAAGAEEFFKLNYGRILPAQRAAAEKALESRSVEVKAIATADRLFADGDYEKAITEAYKITNPAERLAVEARLGQLKTQMDAGREATDKALLEEGMGYIVSGRGLPADLLRRASPTVVDRLQSEQRTRKLWDQQYATLSAQERAALKEASAVSKDYFKGLAAYDPATYVGGPDQWPDSVKQDWDRLLPEHQSEILADINGRRAAGGTVTEADKVLKDLVSQIPVVGPDNRQGINYETGSGGQPGKRTLTDEEKAVRAALYRQAQEYARRTGGAPVTPQDSKVMIARAFREASPTRYPYPEPGKFVGDIAQGIRQNPVYTTTREVLAKSLGREPTDQEIIETVQALGAKK